MTASFAKIGKVVNQAAYESAGTGRRAGSWYAPGSGSNAALLSSLSNLRNRSRAGMRNNPWIAKGINSLVVNEVGTGIVPRSRASDEEVRKNINELWDISISEFDPAGILNFFGMQAQIVRARRTSGEVFIRKRPRALGTYVVPMQIQVLESDFVPHDKNETLRKKFRNLIKGFRVLKEKKVIRDLARVYIEKEIFSEKYIYDALHVAIASYYEISYLVSWNYEHLVKVKTRRLVNSVNLLEGFKGIEIVSPLEL